MYSFACSDSSNVFSCLLLSDAIASDVFAKKKMQKQQDQQEDLRSL